MICLFDLGLSEGDSKIEAKIDAMLQPFRLAVYMFLQLVTNLVPPSLFWWMASSQQRYLKVQGNHTIDGNISCIIC